MNRRVEKNLCLMGLTAQWSRSPLCPHYTAQHPHVHPGLAKGLNEWLEDEDWRVCQTWAGALVLHLLVL